jgi:hypothetical protein
MPYDEEMKDWSDSQLFERFEKDIIYDAHGFIQRFERSNAQEELFQRGKEILRPVIDHLLAQLPQGDLRIAWTRLLNRIEIKIDPEKSGPRDLRNVRGWIRWAEKFAA